MRHKIIFLFISVCPFFAFSQSYISADSANKMIMDGGDCSDRTFTKIQTLPSLKIPKQAFIDSISTYLSSKGSTFGDGTIIMSFIVTCHSKIKEIRKVLGETMDAATLQEGILKFSDLWLPGRQNNYIDNSYVFLGMEFKNNTLTTIIISQ